jgi:hypothetical protein
MYVANYETTESVELPDTRTQFYSKVARELLILRRSRQSGSRMARGSLERQREQVLGRIALQNMSETYQPVNSIMRADAVESVKCITGISSTAEAESFFDRLATETGIIEDEQPGESVRFIHRTFCEYLAAIESVKGADESLSALLGLHQSFVRSGTPQERTRLVEVIPFACALIAQRSVQTELLSRVAESQDWELVGRCLLETQAYDHPAWLAYETAESTYLASVPRQCWDNQWLQRVHPFRSLLSDAEAVATISFNVVGPRESFEVFFKRIISNAEDDVVDLFNLFAAEDASAAYRFAEESGLDLLGKRPDLIVRSCESPPFLALAIERLQGSVDSQMWATILAEAALRYKVVAAALEALPGNKFSTLPTYASRQCWPFLPANSLRSVCMRASSVPSELRTQFPLMTLLLMAKAFGKSKVRAAGWITASLAWTLVVTPLFFSVLLPTRNEEGGQRAPTEYPPSTWVLIILVVTVVLILPLLIIGTIGFSLLLGVVRERVIAWRLMNFHQDPKNAFSDANSEWLAARATRGWISALTLPMHRSAALVSAAFDAIRSGVFEIEPGSDWSASLLQRSICIEVPQGEAGSVRVVITMRTLGRYKILRTASSGLLEQTAVRFGRTDLTSSP